jgi:predicted NodU family carbamoyl transferase
MGVAEIAQTLGFSVRQIQYRVRGAAPLGELVNELLISMHRLQNEQRRANHRMVRLMHSFQRFAVALDQHPSENLFM